MKPFPPNVPWGELYVRSGLKTLSDRVRQRPIVRRVRGAVDDLRTGVLNVARERLPEASAFAERLIKQALSSDGLGPRALVNATGVIAPSGLSLPLADEAVAAMNDTARGYSHYTADAELLLMKQTGGEAALVLHSCAAATTAVLGALGGPVVASRDHVGEVDGVSLVELAAAAGATISEAGIRGRVSLDDYRGVLGERGKGCLWYARPQSLAILGVTSEPGAAEVFAVARDRRVPSVEHLEAAALDNLVVADEFSIPVVKASLLAGADLVIFPGDRFIGGPACGVILGRSDLVARVAAQPLARAAAIDPVRLAGLVATLQLSTDRERATTIPVRQLLHASAENLRHRAERLAAQIAGCPQVSAAEIVSSPGFLTDGRLPSQQMAGWAVAISLADVNVEAMAPHRLLQLPAGIAVSRDEDRLIVNLRSVLARQDEQIAAAFKD